MSVHWWNRWPNRYKYELRELRRAGFIVRHDREALRAGVARLEVSGMIAGKERRARVVFPDLYPYFRFEIELPGESLPYHQHPGSRFLCTLGRSTYKWHPSYTVEWMLREQVPKVFTAGQLGEPIQFRGMEEAQGEPFGDYYVYSPSMIIVDPKWQIPLSEPFGPFSVITASEAPPAGAPFIRGAISELRDSTGRVLFRGDPALRNAFSGPTLGGQWIRADAPISEFDPRRFVAVVRERTKGLTKNNLYNFH